jgi:hypothetical protein
MGKDKYTFKTKLHLCCADDELRPAMACIHFVGGYAYAASGCVAIKQPIDYHSILNPEFLEGKSIHKDSYSKIMSYEFAECEELGIRCKTEDGREVFFKYHDLSSQKIPNVDKVITNAVKKKIDAFETLVIGVNPEYLKDLFNAMHGDVGVKLTVTGKVSPIIVQVPGDNEQIGIIMPVQVDDTLF